MAEADPSDRRITLWVPNESEERRACAYYREVLMELGFTVRLRVVKRRQYEAAVGKPSRPNLDTGWFSWFAEYPHPNDLFERQLSGWAILPAYNENLAQIDIPKLDTLSLALASKPGAIPEAGYAALDRIYTALAPWVPFGTRTEQLFVSKAIDLRGVIWNPTFGADLTSFRFK